MITLFSGNFLSDEVRLLWVFFNCIFFKEVTSWSNCVGNTEILNILFKNGKCSFDELHTCEFNMNYDVHRLWDNRDTSRGQWDQPMYSLAENVCHLATFIIAFQSVKNSPLPAQSCYRWRQRWHRMHCREKEQELTTGYSSHVYCMLQVDTSPFWIHHNGPYQDQHDLRGFHW